MNEMESVFVVCYQRRILLRKGFDSNCLGPRLAHKVTEIDATVDGI